MSSASWCLEEFRFATPTGVDRSVLILPKSLPPHALVLWLPPTLGGGSAEEESARRSHLNTEFAAAAARGGLACAWAHESSDIPSLWAALTDHHAISRSRVAIVAAGSSVRRLTESQSRILVQRRPSGIVLVDPPEGSRLESFLGASLELIALERSLNARPLEQWEAWVATHREHSAGIGFQSVPRATEHLMDEAEWIAGRNIVSNGVISAIMDAAARVLRPVWERQNRRVGTAIGPPEAPH